MRDKPKLTLVPGCGMKLRTTPRLARIKVRPKVVPTDAGQLLDLQDPLGRDFLTPLRDGLGGDADQVGERPLRAGGGQKFKGSSHETGIYTAGLHLSTTGSLPSQGLPAHYQPMVDKRLKRAAPAPDPTGFTALADWVISATKERHGMAQELATYCGVDRQNVTKWQKGSLPTGPVLRKAIAEWAQVEYEKLRDLIERDEARGVPRSAPPKSKVKKSSKHIRLVRGQA